MRSVLAWMGPLDAWRGPCGGPNGRLADNTLLRDCLARIERQYGKARRIWLMDRGIPTEAVLAEMRGADPPVQYLVGTPKGRLTRLEKDLLAMPWQQAPPGVSPRSVIEQIAAMQVIDVHV